MRLALYYVPLALHPSSASRPASGRTKGERSSSPLGTTEGVSLRLPRRGTTLFSRASCVAGQRAKLAALWAYIASHFVLPKGHETKRKSKAASCCARKKDSEGPLGIYSGIEKEGYYTIYARRGPPWAALRPFGPLWG